MKLKHSFSIKQRIKSFGPALEGLRILIITQHNARIHAVAAITVTALSIWLRISALKFCLLLLGMISVLVAEAFNTSIEVLASMISQSPSAKAKRAKDVAAAAVFLTAVGAVVLGLIILLPAFLERLHFS